VLWQRVVVEHVVVHKVAAALRPGHGLAFTSARPSNFSCCSFWSKTLQNCKCSAFQNIV
jgi:hypothetical protein